MKKEKIFFWAADFKTNSGEGRLGRLYIDYFAKKIENRVIKIPLPKNKLINYKYIIPFIGIIICWVYFFRNKKVIYLNYLPYWNFLIFILLPPKTILGPITGGSHFNKNTKDYFIRKYIFPILYYFSNQILKIRYEKFVFSTDLLKKKLPKKIVKKSKFNFVFKAIRKETKTKKIKKKIDFLFYYRKHKNKKTFFPFDLLKKLIRQNYKIFIVGDNLKFRGIKNLGYISYNSINKFLNKTRYTVISNENVFSFFTIDAINNNVKILIDEKNYNKLKHYKKKFVKFNFNKNNLKKIKL